MKTERKNKQNVPNLRFPGFGGIEGNLYKKHFFKDIFVFTTGKNIKQSEASPEFETPCVRYGELYHMYNEVINEVINRTNFDKSELIFSEGDEILLPSAGEDPLDIGAASALTIENVAIGRTINILKPLKANIYSQIYVAYYINHKLRKKISTLAKGVSISNVYNSDLKTLEIALPNLKEQDKIVSFLSLIDERIQTQNEIIDNFESLRHGLRQEILSQKIRFKDEQKHIFPEWENMKLGEVSNLKNGYPFKSKSYVRDGKYNIITISNVQDGEMNTIDCKRIDNLPLDIQKHQLLKHGDILISLTGNVGRLALVNYDDCLLNQRVGKLEIQHNSSNFIFHTLRLNRFKKRMISLAQGGAQLNLGKRDIDLYKLALPNKQEQSKIANFLSSIDNKIETEKRLLKQFQSQKRYFLQNLFI